MKVNTEGRVIKEDGSEAILKDGEAMTVEGQLVKSKEKDFLKERIKMNYDEVVSLEQSKWEMQETIFMFVLKARLMDQKMDLINQKMMIVLDFMNKPKNKRKHLREYIENIAVLDEAIKEVDFKIREVDALMNGGNLDNE